MKIELNTLAYLVQLSLEQWKLKQELCAVELQSSMESERYRACGMQKAGVVAAKFWVFTQAVAHPA